MEILNFMRAKEKNAGIYSIQVCPIRSPFSSFEAYSACTSLVLDPYEWALNVCCMCIVKYADIHWSSSFRFNRSHHFEWNTWYSITWSLLCFSLLVIHFNHLTRTNTYMQWLFLLTSIPTMNEHSKTNSTLLSCLNSGAGRIRVYINIIYLMIDRRIRMISIEWYRWMSELLANGWYWMAACACLRSCVHWCLCIDQWKSQVICV